MTTLDGVERTFTADDLLICDADDEPIGIAGIMGGARHRDHRRHDHGRARDRLVRAADRDRQTAARLGLRSEASARFERGVDPYGIDTAIARFAELLARDVSRSRRARRRGRRTRPTACRPSDAHDRRAHRARSTASSAPTLAADDLAAAARPDRLHRDRRRATSRTVALPSWRPDSTEEIDVVEEVARHYGYDRIGKTRAEVGRATAG